ncbi:hypothetical protein [Streptomyces nymphaeiformis]|uniref:Uncharacterized protein n=1 Tax=Streptomyces nymphaeiformis TaxID=2663842 RepID=A0A7W7U0Q2_9ACTN|nr:hypothetical protein [Streptomyces nymphaeiformis]MBB4981495.1 hypothetical protein [Streptomyces nymphaeiformis]
MLPPGLTRQHHQPGGPAPEYYSSIGEAIGAAMQHNIRLAHSGRRPIDDPPLQVRRIPSAADDPYSVPGMIARLTEDAAPDEVAGIVEEINGALVGALPQLTELVAAAADWVRVRLAFDDPHHNSAMETWTRLAAAHGLLEDVREQLEAAEDGIAACPAERTDPRHHNMIYVLRTRELLDDVLGAGADPSPPGIQSPKEADRPVSASNCSSPTSSSTTSPASPRSTEGSPMGNLADTYGTEVEIYPWADGLVWADCRTGLPGSAQRILRSCGFIAPADQGDPASFSLDSHVTGPDRQLAASAAASQLADLGYRVAIDPSLAVGYVGETSDTNARRQAAARQTSPIAAKASTGTGTNAPPAPSPVLSAGRPAPRSR